MNDPDDKQDELAFGPEIAPGMRVGLRRSPDGEIMQVACRPVRNGVPLLPGSEIMHIGEMSEPGWHKLTRLYKAAGDGPAQVATPAYRDGYERIFGKQEVGLA